jgi:hypothetical protein
MPVEHGLALSKNDLLLELGACGNFKAKQAPSAPNTALAALSDCTPWLGGDRQHSHQLQIT